MDTKEEGAYTIRILHICVNSRTPTESNKVRSSRRSLFYALARHYMLQKTPRSELRAQKLIFKNSFNYSIWVFKDDDQNVKYYERKKRRKIVLGERES